MSKLLRKVTIKPIPEGARNVIVRGEKLAKWTTKKGKECSAFLNESGDRLRIVSRKWYGRIPGVDKPVPLCTNKDAAQMMLADLIRKAELAKAGVVDRFEGHRTKPLAEHLNDFEAALTASGANPRHVRQTVGYARSVVEGCGFTFMADVSAAPVQRAAS